MVTHFGGSQTWDEKFKNACRNLVRKPGSGCDEFVSCVATLAWCMKLRPSGFSHSQKPKCCWGDTYGQAIKARLGVESSLIYYGIAEPSRLRNLISGPAQLPPSSHSASSSDEGILNACPSSLFTRMHTYMYGAHQPSDDLMNASPVSPPEAEQY
ncbi:predicted protein [Histoplasma capsulatum G186AR]|uniref:Uncharacterized protein n=1 Tax=Ajellomyces capsulatus (strain G186AR / H82 / ATCC MYA-2454 / RMSCC 2432) TaxID=447093 RepID=C0NT11_AJECG|nr:uncharacterized protein HCBG_06291 [Histoplasma capsulatum G186AR]EEH05172.1 predicted protein [Histoplasma capsulatum G186AR]